MKNSHFDLMQLNCITLQIIISDHPEESKYEIARGPLESTVLLSLQYHKKIPYWTKNRWTKLSKFRIGVKNFVRRKFSQIF